MNGPFQNSFTSDPIGTGAVFILAVLLFVCIELPIIIGVLYGFYYLLTLPLRRNERARLFLDILETGIASGKTIESSIMEASASGDPVFGGGMHRLAANLHGGMSLTDALDHPTRALNPEVRAMLKAGLRIGDVRKVLPACRQLLRDSLSQVRGALNHLVLIFFCVTPAIIVLPVMIGILILPKFKEVFRGMSGGSVPAFTQFVFDYYPALIALQVCILSLGWFVTVAYIGGPRLRGLFRTLTFSVGEPGRAWLGVLFVSIPDALVYRLPWKRKRLQRDFTTILAVLLDAGMTETDAVSLAAESTANHSMIRRGNKMRALLSDGTKLPDALRVMDDGRELQWRLRNVLGRRGTFVRALTSWHESLDSRAFQLEQTAAQVTTTGMVLFNGFVVAVFIIAMFLALIQIINEAVLW